MPHVVIPERKQVSPLKRRNYRPMPNFDSITMFPDKSEMSEDQIRHALSQNSSHLSGIYGSDNEVKKKLYKQPVRPQIGSIRSINMFNMVS
jgi:hypothetical protein